MKVRNTSNYPKKVDGVLVQPKTVEEVSLDSEEDLWHDRLEVVDDDSSESVDEESSKPGKNEEEGEK